MANPIQLLGREAEEEKGETARLVSFFWGCFYKLFFSFSLPFLFLFVFLFVFSFVFLFVFALQFLFFFDSFVSFLQLWNMGVKPPRFSPYFFQNTILFTNSPFSSLYLSFSTLRAPLLELSLSLTLSKLPSAPREW